MLVTLAVPTYAEASFERIEIELDRPADCWLADDIDRDGDVDLVLIRQAANPGSPVHEAVVIRQNPTGRFAFSERQEFSLHSPVGVYDLADVAAGASLELLQLTDSGLNYYRVDGAQFDTVAHALVTPSKTPHLPPIASPQRWDCAWPLFDSEKEAVVLPYLDHLEVWRLGEGEEYQHTGTIPCPVAGQRATDGTGYQMMLPELQAHSSPNALELFFESGDHWHGIRRSAPEQTDFSTSLSFDSESSTIGQVMGIAPDFRAGCLMQDLNADGAPDVVRWANHGGINSASCHIAVYFGPFNGSLSAQPHSEVSVEGIYGYPRFGDLNGDDRLDMLVCAMETGSLTTAKMFVMKRLSLHLLAYRQREDNTFSTVADRRQSTDYKLDLDVPDPIHGPLVTFAGDLDGDGFDDFVFQTGSDRLDIYRGHPEDMIDDDSPQHLECAPARSISSLDVDGDGRPDLLLHHSNSESGDAITTLLAR
ncbi:MAG: hypothetical protein GF341_11820 [candidate division Zixibacteria bacterium]|nr:hypothetical protein [candidate division Zixibacteria bacterium]